MIALSCGTPQRICVRRIGQLDLTPLAGTEEGLDPFFSPSGAWLAFVSGTRLKKVRLDGGPVVDLTAGFWEGGAWSPDDQLIYAPNSSTGLYRIPASGGAPQVLTAPDSARREVGHWWPQLLPDGHTVIFSDYAFPFKNSRIEAVDLRSRKRTVLVEGAVYGLYVKTGHLLFTRGTRTVYAVRLNTSTLKTEGEPVQVLDDVEILRPAGLSSFTVSDNGTLAYLPRSRWTPQTSLVWVDRSGKEEPLPLEPGDLSEPRISPDNKKVSFTRTDEHRDVWLFDRARSLATPFTRHEGEAFGSVWMPDSRRILYISERPGFEIYWRAADLGSPEERLPQSTGGDNVPISVSPDGKLLAYGEFALAAHIRFLALDGSATSITFPATPQSQWQPVFSPDGRWLAYTSDESGRAEVYVRPFPNLTGARQQVSSDGGGEARWSRAGREIIFRHGSRMMTTSFDPAAGVPGRPVELFRGDYVQAYPVGSYSYDVTLDGNRFLMAKPQATGGRDVVIVVNWFAELARTLAKK